jgi:hypothetical protein
MEINTLIPFFLILFITIGFFIVYILKNILNSDISSFEFYYLSATCSFFLFFIAYLIYSRIPNVEPIETIDDMVKKLLDLLFLGLIIVSILLIFFITIILYKIGIYQKIRKYLSIEKGYQSSPKDVWQNMLKKYGYLLVYTKDGEIYYGVRRHFSESGEELELFLCEPEIFKDGEFLEVSDEFDLPVKSLLFLREDIKRIAFVSYKELEDCKKIP